MSGPVSFDKIVEMSKGKKLSDRLKPDRTNTERTQGPVIRNKAHTDMVMMREGIRSWRTRVRWLFARSSFVMISFAMLIVPIALFGTSSLFPGAFGSDYVRTFLNAALGTAIVMVQIGIIFKLYALSIDLEIWFYSLAGAQATMLTSGKTKFLKLCAMAFLGISMVFLVWGMLVPLIHRDPHHDATLILGGTHHFINLALDTSTDKMHKLAVLSLLMAIVSQLYFLELRREDLRSHAERR